MIRRLLPPRIQSFVLRSSERRIPSRARRAPKVTVTRDGVSLCQKGVTPWLLFVVNYFLASKRAKTSRGAGCVLPSTRPPAVEGGRALMEGGPGGGLVSRVIHNGLRYTEWTFV